MDVRTPLQVCGQMANVLSSQAYLDSTSKVQRDAMRVAADAIVEALKAASVQLTPTVVYAMSVGAQVQLQGNPAEVSVLMAVLAQDVITAAINPEG